MYYYGAGWEKIKEYMASMAAHAMRNNTHLGIFDKGDKMCVPYTMSVYNAKLNRIVEDSIAKIDMDAYTLNSEKQAMMTNVNLDSIIANLIVSDGDLETEWKAAIAENAYIVDPAVEELNELFCK